MRKELHFRLGGNYGDFLKEEKRVRKCRTKAIYIKILFFNIHVYDGTLQ